MSFDINVLEQRIATQIKELESENNQVVDRILRQQPQIMIDCEHCEKYNRIFLREDWFPMEERITKAFNDGAKAMLNELSKIIKHMKEDSE